MLTRSPGRRGGGRLGPPTPAPTLVAALATVLLLTGSGCAGSTEAAPGGAGVGPAGAVAAGAVACRARWHRFADSLAGRDQQVDPSDLADRWGTVLGTAQYYVTSATAKDCGAPLAQQRATVRAIQDWSARLRGYDIPYRFAALAPVATDYLLGTGPSVTANPTSTSTATSTATPTATPTAAPASRAPTAPTKKQVQQALTTLQNTATLATTDMQAGWDEANAVDLTDPAAVRKALADLSFLAQDSTPYQTCTAALAVLERARAARS